MAKFSYTVQDSQGKASNGIIEALDEDQAVTALQNKGFFVVSITQEAEAKTITGKKKAAGGKVPDQEMAFFAEQMATLLAGGVPLVRALSLLGDFASNPNLGVVVRAIGRDVASGSPFHKAMEKHPKIFDTIWVSLVQAGELGGQLPQALKQVADYTQRAASTKSKIITAVAYPAVLALMSGGVLIYFVLFIVPVFRDIFKDFGIELPVITQIIVGISDTIINNFVLIILGFVAFGVGFKMYIGTHSGLYTWNKFVFKIPLFGNFVRNMLLERMLTTMGTLLRSGVSILNTIAVLERSFAKNLIYQNALKQVKNEVASGKSISLAFKNTNVFPGLMTEMMLMGEESGKLPDIIRTLSSFYTEQINQFLARFSSMIDPILVVGIGGVVGVIVLSIFMPIFKMSSISG